MRLFNDKAFKMTCIIAATVMLSILLYIIIVILEKGIMAMNIDMITQLPKGGFYLGGEGGILNAIVGSLYLVAGAIILSTIISIPVVMYMNFYLKRKSFFARFLRLSFDILFGIPSIVYGAFGFALMIYLGMKASLLGGIITNTFLIIPNMIRTIDEVAVMVPKEPKEGPKALGATNFETILVIIRYLMPGITTATLLAVGRGIGDAATVLFTAGYTDSIPTGLSQPTASLPLAIFFQLGSPVEEVQQRAYASALILTIIILILSFGARYFSKKLVKNKI